MVKIHQKLAAKELRNLIQAKMRLKMSLGRFKRRDAMDHGFFLSKKIGVKHGTTGMKLTIYNGDIMAI